MAIPQAFALDSHGRAAAATIIRCFEAGRPLGGYATVTDVKSDPGGVSYGWFQAADAGGALDQVVQVYMDVKGSLATEFEPFLDLLADPRLPLRGNSSFLRLLRRAAEDPKMRRAQDFVFESRYGAPAAEYAARVLGLRTALGYAIVLDSFVHSGTVPSSIRARFPEVPPSKGGDESAWLSAYVEARRAWLAAKVGILARTTYRMDTFRTLLRERNFGLVTPFKVKVGRSFLPLEDSDISMPPGSLKSPDPFRTDPPELAGR